MATEVRRVEYFYCNVHDRPGEGARLLSALADAGVNLLAFNAIPMGLAQTQMVLFPEQPDLLVRAAEDEGFDLDGPHAALMIRGDDEIGALAVLHRRLADTGINVSASVGVTDGRGGFSAVVYLNAHDADRAEHALRAVAIG
jgi:hypothetical protein